MPGEIAFRAWQTVKMCKSHGRCCHDKRQYNTWRFCWKTCQCVCGATIGPALSPTQWCHSVCETSAAIMRTSITGNAISWPIRSTVKKKKKNTPACRYKAIMFLSAVTALQCYLPASCVTQTSSYHQQAQIQKCVSVDVCWFVFACSLEAGGGNSLSQECAADFHQNTFCNCFW